jgi:hypothetical protein
VKPLAPLSLLLVLALGGCIAEVTFDPVGTAASVEGSWTIGGAVASAEACRALGIDYVRVRFYRDMRTSDHPHLVFPCERGSFDTSPERIVAEGTWTMALVAIDAEGNPIAVGPRETLSTSSGHIALAPVDFTVAGFDPSGTDATLHARWTIGGSPASADACDAVAAATIDLVLYAHDDLARTMPAIVHEGAPCADGGSDSGTPAVAAGEYLVSGVLRGRAGEVVSRVDPVMPVTVSAGAPLAMDLDFRLEDALVDVRALWDDPGTGAPTTCEAAGVGRMTWRADYVDASGALTSDVADSGGPVACTEHVVIARTSLAPGTYRVHFEGADATGTTRWMVQGACDAEVDAPGGLGIASCHAAYSSP